MKVKKKKRGYVIELVKSYPELTQFLIWSKIEVVMTWLSEMAFNYLCQTRKWY